MNRKRLLIIIGIVVTVVVLVVVFDTIVANRPPTIISLEAEPERVFPSGSTQIVCTASDRDGDELSYNWSASGGAISGEGATVTWTAPLSVGSYNVTVTVTDGRGREAMKTITIGVRTNRPPTITSLTTDAEWTLPSGSVQVTCDASDPDGDVLSYEWTATGGDITGIGDEATWTAPQELGVYSITVVVYDGHGGSATKTQPIIVATGQPPIIEALLVTAEHKYLKKTTSGYLVGEGKDFRIQCTASHPDGLELSYKWECEGGEVSEMSEDGSSITWTAPYTRNVKLTVTVTVSDIYGNMVSQDIVLEVRSCGSFG